MLVLELIMPQCTVFYALLEKRRFLEDLNEMRPCPLLLGQGTKSA